MNKSDLDLQGPSLLQKKGLMNKEGIASTDLCFFEEAVASVRKRENQETLLSKECWRRMFVNDQEFTTQIRIGSVVPEHLQNVEPVYAGKTTVSMFSQGEKY